MELQNSGEFDKIFIMIADAQALTDNADNPAKIRDNIMEVALDYLSVGLDPAKSNIFIQSHVAELTELMSPSKVPFVTSTGRLLAMIIWYFISQLASFLEQVFPQWNPMNVSVCL